MRDLIQDVFDDPGFGPSDLHSGLPSESADIDSLERLLKLPGRADCVRRQKPRRQPRFFAVRTSDHRLADEGPLLNSETRSLRQS